MPILAGMVTSNGGRFVPPLTVARSGLGLTAGQFKITDTNYTQMNYTPTGEASVAGNIITLPRAPSGAAASGTVQAFAAKGIMGSTVVNVTRTPYTYYSYTTDTPYCGTHYHGGKCAAGGNHQSFYGPYQNGTPSGYTDSEGEWWKIW